MEFHHFLILAFVAAILTLWGRFLFARRTEYYRQRPVVKEVIGDMIPKIRQHNFPWVLVKDDATDDIVRDILQVMSYYKRIGFKKKWNKYRQDTDKYENLGTSSARSLIIERLQEIISMI